MKLVFSNRTGVAVRGVRAMFKPSGTNVLSYSVSGLPEGIRLEQADVYGYGVDIVWSHPVTYVDVVLSVEIAGAVLEVACEIWRGAGWDFRRPNASLTLEEAVLLDSKSVWELATRDKWIDTVRNAMVRALPQGSRLVLQAPAELSETMTKSRRFFCELDLCSHPGLMPFVEEGDEVIQRREALIGAMKEELEERVKQRLDWALTHPGIAAKGLRMWSDRSQIEEISRLQLGVYGHHFATSEGIDLAAVWDAFMLFANGELHLLEDKLWEHWNGGPDSAYLFLFAEFAFMACDAGVHTAEWEPLLPPLVAAQRIYMQAYRPDVLAERSLLFEDYVPDNWKPDKMVNQEAKNLLRERFAAFDPHRLRVEAGTNARDAFPGSSRVA